ncbi:2OG-Fe(II) oxygenase [Nocardia sp. NPDC046473]|uniref:2OG-Fe(II) oxygenase n=1 Tax=Nocardia sp. NPDC046473 TaxID=3155733 RepID=UPI0033D6CFBB
MSLFRWTTYNVNSLLPRGWQEQVMQVAQEEYVGRTLVSSHSTSREAAAYELRCGGVGGNALRTRLPWLNKLYEGRFLELAQSMSNETVTTMLDDRFSMVLNIQRETERYECHVDTNPIEGLLYCTSHYPGDGGELVVSNRGDVGSIEEVDEDCAIIEPRAGYLVFFDARYHSHYVRRLTDPSNVRIVAAMNYYTESCPEWKVRPSDLNRHLSGHD